MKKSLTENQARALYMLNSRHYDNTGPGWTLLSDLDDWGLNRLELQNIKRQIQGGLLDKGLTAVSSMDGYPVFHLTEEAYPALSRWLHLEGGEEIVNTWF